MSVRIVYQDIAPDAAEDAAISAAGAASISTLSLLPFREARTNYPSLERNRWALSGAYSVTQSPQIAFWSEEISDADGNFTTPPEITATFTQNYTATGITLVCGAEEWCTLVRVAWWRDAQELAEQTFAPDGATYFCEKTVEGFNKVTVALLQTVLPYRRARLDTLIFGALRTFGIDELGDVKAIFEVDPTSRTLAENTLDWQLVSQQAVEYLFQDKQPVEAYDGDRLLGTFYITDSDRAAQRRYKITCTDAIGVLGDEPFPDQVVVNKNALELATEICAPFTVEMEDTFKSESVNGAFKGRTRRQALQQLCFRLGAVADTSGTDAIRIFALKGYGAAMIGTDRVRIAGNSVKTGDLVTAIRVTTHSYSTTGTTGEIEIGGVKYYDTQVVHTLLNPDVVSSDKPNVIDINGATLVTEAQADAVLSRLFDYYVRRKTMRLKFRMAGELAGDYVRAQTNWGSTVGGILKRAAVSIKGFAVAESEIVGNVSEGFDAVYPYSGQLYSGQVAPYLGGANG